MISEANNWVDQNDTAAIAGRPFPSGTVVFAKIGEALKHNRKRVITRPTYIDNNLMGAVPIAGAVHPAFLFHLFRTIDIAAANVGTAVPYVKAGTLQKLPLRLPGMNAQQRIAEILGAYDDLIEVNRRRVALLEEMARGLFEEWFVRFRFPGHENRAAPAGEKLPFEWKRGAIGDAYDGLFDGPHATPPVSSSGPVFLGIGNITERGRLDTISTRRIAEEDLARWTKRVAPQEGDIVFTYEATLNRYALIPRDFRGCLGRRLALIRAKSKPGMNFYLYLYFFSQAWRDVIAGNTLSGATVDRIPLSRFPQFPIVIPPDRVVARFGQIVSPIFAQMENLDRSNTALISMRDLLLPRLISGQLSVAEIELELAQAA